MFILSKIGSGLIFIGEEHNTIYVFIKQTQTKQADTKPIKTHNKTTEQLWYNKYIITFARCLIVVKSFHCMFSTYTYE